MITPEQMVQREVLCCMSSLVSTLAKGAYAIESKGDFAHDEVKPLQELCEQAYELAVPVLDYEEAAMQAGWHVYAGVWHHGEAHEHRARTFIARGYLSTQEVCDTNSLDPYEREVFEYWAVSKWLAEKLQAQGERVDTDFAGLNIWARTTTGQAISMDGCIARIHAEMTSPVGASA